MLAIGNEIANFPLSRYDETEGMKQGGMVGYRVPDPRILLHSTRGGRIGSPVGERRVFLWTYFEMPAGNGKPSVIRN